MGGAACVLDLGTTAGEALPSLTPSEEAARRATACLQTSPWEKGCIRDPDTPGRVVTGRWSLPVPALTAAGVYVAHGRQ